MAVILSTGEVIFCESIEVSALLGFLIDGHIAVPVSEVMSIVRWEE